MPFLESERSPWDNCGCEIQISQPNSEGRLRWWKAGKWRRASLGQALHGHFGHIKALHQPSLYSLTPCLLASTAPSPFPSSPFSLPPLLTARGPLTWLVTASGMKILSWWHKCTKFPLSAYNSYPTPKVILRNRLFPPSSLFTLADCWFISRGSSSW